MGRSMAPETLKRCASHLAGQKLSRCRRQGGYQHRYRLPHLGRPPRGCGPRDPRRTRWRRAPGRPLRGRGHPAVWSKRAVARGDDLRGTSCGAGTTAQCLGTCACATGRACTAPTGGDPRGCIGLADLTAGKALGMIAAGAPSNHLRLPAQASSTLMCGGGRREPQSPQRRSAPWTLNAQLVGDVPQPSRPGLSDALLPGLCRPCNKMAPG